MCVAFRALASVWRDCYDSTYPDSAFDTVLMRNLIHVVHDPGKTLKEVHRILKDTGRLVLMSFTADGMRLFDMLGLMYRYVKMFGIMEMSVVGT
jgi:ubiquinone/menaquinone biosynthesis C-methylase UbiE